MCLQILENSAVLGQGAGFQACPYFITHMRSVTEPWAPGLRTRHVAPGQEAGERPGWLAGAPESRT